MKLGECPTPGCLETQAHFSAHYDHLGRMRDFCAVHGGELLGVRERMVALFAQIEGMQRIQVNAGIYCKHAIPIPSRYIDTCLRRRLHKTLQAQGGALLVLIDRERELTGADKP